MWNALWLNDLADSITVSYVAIVCLAVLLFSLPLFWLNRKRLTNSPLRDNQMYWLKKIWGWEMIVFALLIAYLLYHFPNL
jgi:hypothetical protein